MRFYMLFGCMFGMIPGMKIVCMSQVRMMRSLIVIARFMMLRSFRVVMCSQSMMMSRLRVMMRRFLRHRENLHSARRLIVKRPQACYKSSSPCNAPRVTAYSILNQYAVNSRPPLAPLKIRNPKQMWDTQFGHLVKLILNAKGNG
jgi:hypothetical protein